MIAYFCVGARVYLALSRILPSQSQQYGRSLEYQNCEVYWEFVEEYIKDRRKYLLLSTDNLTILDKRSSLDYLAEENLSSQKARAMHIHNDIAHICSSQIQTKYSVSCLVFATKTTSFLRYRFIAYLLF